MTDYHSPGHGSLGTLVARESIAAAAFLRRWSLGTLRRVDPELSQRLLEQQSLWHEARVTGTDEETVRQGEAMCRGWLAAVERLEAAGEPDEPRHTVRLTVDQAAQLRAGLRQALEALAFAG
jgi:hypothetical protein